MRDDTSGAIGRYAPEHDADDPFVRVVLLNFPLQLFAQARQHHDEVMREFALLAMQPPGDRAGQIPERFRELIDELGRHYGATAQRSESRRDEAIERGEVSMDLTYDVPHALTPSLLRMNELMEAAEDFCRSEQLLTLAASPLQRRFRRWYLGQFLSQFAGEPPQPWDGPMQNDAAGE